MARKMMSAIALLIMILSLTFVIFLSKPPQQTGMEKYKEIGRTVMGFLRSSILPAYLTDDVPVQFAAERQSVLRNTYNGEITVETSIISWNILRGYNQNKINQTIEKIISEEKPAVLFLQEVPVYDAGNFWDGDLFKNLNLWYAPLHQVQRQTSFYNFRHTGQLILSAAPFSKTKVYPLPSVTLPNFGEDHIIKRIALYAQLTLDDGRTIGLYNVHLENAAWQTGRKQQIEYLLKIIEENTDDMVIVGGDFNTFLGRLETVPDVLREAGFDNLFERKDFRLLPRLDYFFVKNLSGKAKQIRGRGSDHQPIVAQINFSSQDKNTRK